MHRMQDSEGLDMKSPLKAKPLRNPGESLDRQFYDLIYDEVIQYVIIAFGFVLVAGVEWLRWLRDSPPNPWLYTFIALPVVILAAWKINRALAKARNLRLGRDGEKAVGQYLDGLREAGAKVLHDLPGNGFNIDHVVIHETGVYVIETKTLSKPDRGEAKLIYDGTTVLKGGLKPDRNPIQQVRAARQWLKELLKESTGKEFSVRAVVVYPGWFIQPTAEAKSSDVWVLNPKALPSFIKHSATQLQSEDVSLCAYHLSRYVRSS